MDDDPALYLAQRLLREYDLTVPVSEADLRRLCAAREVAVVTVPDLDGPGYYLPFPVPVILLAPGSGSEVLAHELCHDLTQQNEAVGIIYPYTDAEQAAHRFARLLLGQEAFPAPPPAPEPVLFRVCSLRHGWEFLADRDGYPRIRTGDGSLLWVRPEPAPVPAWPGILWDWLESAGPEARWQAIAAADLALGRWGETNGRRDP